MSYEEKLLAMGVTLPPAPKPLAVYVPAVLTGQHLYVSGQLPYEGGKLAFTGKVGADLTGEEGYRAARLCAIHCLAAIKGVTGSLDGIRRVVKVTGFVNSAPGFTGQPGVINGASEFLGDLFGEAGRHARAAVGVSELPLNAAVEIEMIVEVKGYGAQAAGEGFEG